MTYLRTDLATFPTMPKTKKDLMYALADRIGGEQGQKLREGLAKPLFQDLRSLEQTYTDAEFATELDKLERDLPQALAKLKQAKLDKPATWGLSN